MSRKTSKNQKFVEFDLDDVIVIVESGQADEALAAFKSARANYPGSVLSKLPDADGQPCHFVALSGARVPGASQVPGDQASASTAQAKLSQQQLAVLREDIKKYVRESADDVRAARQQLESAIARQSASDAYSKSLALDTALDQLKGICADGLEKTVATFNSPIEAADEEADSSQVTPTSVEDNEARNSEEYSAQRDQALAQFAGVAAKGGLGKLFSKSKIKVAGEELLSATDSLIESYGADLVDELVTEAQPQLIQREAEENERQRTNALAELSKETEAALSGLTIPAGVDASATVRPWTTGTPKPRHYVVADPSLLDELELEFPTTQLDATQIAVEGLDGIYVLQVQYALSEASLTS